MKRRFGDKVLRMGHLQEYVSMLVPVDCIIEATRSLESRTLTEAAEVINNEPVVSMLQSGEIFVERVGEAREGRLREMIRKFRSEPDANRSHRQWKEIEHAVLVWNTTTRPGRTSNGSTFPRRFASIWKTG